MMKMTAETIDLLVEWQQDPTNVYYIKPDEFELEQLPGFAKPIKKKDGVLMLNDVLNVTNLKNLPIREDDTFIIGFPKSGTTWIEEIVWQVRNGLNFALAEEIYHFARVMYVDRGFSQQAINDFPIPRCYKSHLPPKFYAPGFNKTAKVVYVVRNPKDVIVSTFKFYKSMKQNEFIGTLDELVDLFVEGKLMFGPWWEHLNEYAKLENVHFIHYEDLIEKPIETTRELLKYLGNELNDEDLKKLLTFVSFDNMKKTPSMDMKAIGHLFKDDLNFFSKGQIGTWKEHLSEEQSRKIDEVLAKNLTYKKAIQYEPTKKN